MGYNVQSYATVKLALQGNVVANLHGTSKLVSIAGQTSSLQVGDTLIVEGPDKRGYFHPRTKQNEG
jgi:hypothetical protein